MGGGNAPDGFLLCDGSNVSRKTYADLFSVIGTRFGSGNGSTTFTLPNLVSKFPRGCGKANDVGGSSGADSVTLETKHLPSHTHGLGNHTHSLSHTHTLTPTGTVSSSFSGNEVTGSIGRMDHSHETTGVFSKSDRYYQWNPTGDNDGYACYILFSMTPSGSVSSSFSGNSNTTSSQSDSTTSKASGDTDSTGSDTAFSIVPSYVNFYYIIKY